VATSEMHYEESDPSELHTEEKARVVRGRGRRGKAGPDGIHHTRIGRAWIAVIVAAVLGVALVDFIVQNTRSVRIEFFGASGQIPVAVALLGAALVGAFIVLAVGIARTTQLRIATRRGKRREKKAESLAAQREG
jgi:uncharacterized integral membrane protein